MFTPSRRRGVEILDNPALNPALAIRSLRDVSLSNRLFGGRSAVVCELRGLIQRALSDRAAADRATRQRTPLSDMVISLLDVGTGRGDIPLAAHREIEDMGLRVATIGLEVTPTLAIAASASCTHTVAADARMLPFPDESIDIVICSQLLHHFDDAAGDALLRECNRVARMGVVVGDLQRSWFAVGALWCASFLLGFHPVSRHDGVVSILRGFTASELKAVVKRLPTRRISVRRRFAWRVTATWAPDRTRPR